MAYELIPFPISILFALVFGVAVIVVLWKLRGRGKVYKLLSDFTLIFAVLVVAVFIYVLLTAHASQVLVERYCSLLNRT